MYVSWMNLTFQMLFAKALERVVNVDNVNLTYRNIPKMTKLSIVRLKLAGGPLYIFGADLISCDPVKFKSENKEWHIIDIIKVAYHSYKTSRQS